MMNIQENSQDSSVKPVIHAGTVTLLSAAEPNVPFQPFRLETIAHDGAYGVSFRIEIPESACRFGLRAVVDIEVESGAVGIGLLSEDYSSFLGVESVILSGSRRKVSIAMAGADAVKQLMLRNANHDGASIARVYGIDMTDRQLDSDELFGDLDELGRATAQDTPLPFLFCVVSWGAAATQWLAATLNAHPEIFCVHCANQFWERLGGSRSLDGWEYLRILGCESPSSRACGDVHGVSRETIPDLRSKLGNRFNCAVLVREPLPRLRSQMAHFVNWPVKSAWHVDYVQKFIEEGVRLPQDNVVNRLFLHGVNMLNNIILEEPVAPLWRSEELTSSAVALARFVEELTRGNVSVERDWAERVVNRPPSNRHRQPSVDAAQFEPWQMEAIKKIVTPQAWRIYERLGYATPDFIR